MKHKHNIIIQKNNIKEINHFLKLLSLFNNVNITQIELEPIKINELNTYISGLKKINELTIEIHIKKINQINNHEENFWINANIIQQNILSNAIKQLKYNYLKLNGNFTLVNVTLINKQQQIIQENIIYQNKKIACKDIINKRKLIPNTKYKFLNEQLILNENMADKPL